MKISNKVLAFSIATTLTVSPLMVSANENKEVLEINPIKTEVMPIDTEVIKEDKAENMFFKYEGKIKEITKDGKSFSVLVKGNDKDEDSMIFHIDEKVLLLSNKTKDFINKDSLKEGNDVTAFYNKSTPVAQSLPAQLTPGFLVVRENEESVSVHIDRFNKELTSSDKTLKLNLDDKVVIVDKDGKPVKDRNLADKDLIVFYTISTKSIPAQTTPQKVIVLDGDNVVEKPDTPIKQKSEIKVLNKMKINKKEVTLTDSAYKNKEGVVMIPLREITEALGYEIKWNAETRSAELTKGAQWTSVKIGEDNYNFAKMIVNLGTAPELKDSKTFVPFTFLEEVLKVNVDIDKAGMAHIE